MNTIYKSAFTKLFFALALMLTSVSFSAETIPINRLPSHGSIRVQGKVTKIFNENEFLITDKSGSIMISTGETFTYIPLGEIVSVTGELIEQTSFFSKYRQMHATQIRRANGKAVSIQ